MEARLVVLLHRLTVDDLSKYINIDKKKQSSPLSVRKLVDITNMPNSKNTPALSEAMNGSLASESSNETCHSEVANETLSDATNETVLSESPTKHRFRKMTQEEKEERKRKREKLEQKEAEERREAALIQMRYLLTTCEQFSNVFRSTIQNQSALPSTERNNRINRDYVQPTLSDVEEIRQDIRVNPTQAKNIDVLKNLKYFENGSLHPYQVEGVTWMYTLYVNATNGILADEMGLGKTIQIIALICVLLARGVTGPYLIVAPLSTIPNWESEFERFAPQIPVVAITGSAEARAESLERILIKQKVGNCNTYPVVLVSYQTPLLEFNTLNRFSWRYIIVDEGHRLKNHQSQLSQKLRQLNSKNRMILTGTPLHNNIVELWALLNFLLPTVFVNMDVFGDLLLIEDIKNEKIIEEEESNSLVSQLHQVLTPFMLRRTKKDVLKDLVPKKEVTVYCPLSSLQLKLYDFVIERNLAGLKGISPDNNIDEPKAKRKCTFKRKYYTMDQLDELIEEQFDELDEELEGIKLDANDVNTSKTELNKFATTLTRVTLNPLMMFRKIVNHPYLVHFPLDPNSETKQLLINEDLITTSGKLLVLDTLLPELKKRGHKILLFSQLCMGLDLIEEYMIMRNYNYRRLDGNFKLAERAQNMKDFNEDSEVFIFLLSTRAGGLGLNLTGADTVIFFDRDWNPQMDIQAQDRCHRLGQTKPVVVYTLVAKNTIDEAIISKGKLKRVLEKVVISDGKFKSITKDDNIRTEDLLVELRNALRQSSEEDSYIFSNQLELDKLLDRSDLYELMRQRLEQPSCSTSPSSSGPSSPSTSGRSTPRRSSRRRNSNNQNQEYRS